MVTLENVDSENQKKIVDHYRDYNVNNLEKELTLVLKQKIMLNFYLMTGFISQYIR
jgi:hypothetical protein